MEQDFHVFSIYYSFVFYIKAILLSPTKVKVKIKVCKKSVYHKCCPFLRRCKNSIIFNKYNLFVRKKFK